MATHSSILAWKIPGLISFTKDWLDLLAVQETLIYYGASQVVLVVKNLEFRKCNKSRFNPWWGRSSGGGHGNPLQHSCMENPIDKGAWCSTVCRAAESGTTEVTEHVHTHVYVTTFPRFHFVLCSSLFVFSLAVWKVYIFVLVVVFILLFIMPLFLSLFCLLKISLFNFISLNKII